MRKNENSLLAAWMADAWFVQVLRPYVGKCNFGPGGGEAAASTGPSQSGLA